MLTGFNGFLAVLFGIIALLFPSITVVALAVYFAVSVLIGGIILTISSFRVKNHFPQWQFVLTEGIIGIVLGVLILMRPELTAAMFVVLFGIWATLLGLIIIGTSFRRETPGNNKVFLLITGILSLIFGILITVNPFEGSRVIVVFIGIYAIAYGLFSIINKIKLYYGTG